MVTQICTYFQKLKNESGAAMGTEVISGGSQRSRFLFRMPSAATVDAHILENHDASVEINRSFGSKTSLALPTSLDAFFSHAPKGMLERMDGLLVKTMVSQVHI
jgi:hypothetical protein